MRDATFFQNSSKGAALISTHVHTRGATRFAFNLSAHVFDCNHAPLAESNQCQMIRSSSQTHFDPRALRVARWSASFSRSPPCRISTHPPCRGRDFPISTAKRLRHYFKLRPPQGRDSPCFQLIRSCFDYNPCIPAVTTALHATKSASKCISTHAPFGRHEQPIPAHRISTRAPHKRESIHHHFSPRVSQGNATNNLKIGRFRTHCPAKIQEAQRPISSHLAF